MSPPLRFAYIYENLKPLTALSEGTWLCIYPPRNTLYVKKEIPQACVSYYHTLASINSRNLAPVLFVTEEGDTAFVLSEYVSGQSLSGLLQEGKTFSQEEARGICTQVCFGLWELHRRGLVHRDINPNNIIISSDNVVKIIDFGIVRSFTQDKIRDTVIMGTPGYAAPEQFGFLQSDARTDIYAVGVLLNQLLTGRFPNERLAPGKLGTVVRRCVEIDAQKRFSSIDQLMNQLSGSAVPGLETVLDTLPGFRSRRGGQAFGAVLLYLLAGMAVVQSYMSLKTPPWGYAVHTVSVLFSTVIPFFCFHNFLNVWERFPFTRYASRKSQKILFRGLGIVSLFIGLAIFGSIA